VQYFKNIFIAFLYMFRATMCPSSGENTVPMRRLVFVTLYEWLFCVETAFYNGLLKERYKGG